MKGSPNSEFGKRNFVAKVLHNGEYMPIYTASDATDSSRGEVYLSDAVNEDSNAAKGVVAATPLAVKTVNENANNKLDKLSVDKQTVQSEVEFNGKITADSGVVGNLEGNADSATQLSNPITLNVKTGANPAGGEYIATATFQSGNDTPTISIQNINGGLISSPIPLSMVPQAALERLTIVENEQKLKLLTAKDVQTGDTVKIKDTNIMYLVVDESKLSADGVTEGSMEAFVEYAAGTAAKAKEADHAVQSDQAINANNADVATTANSLAHALTVNHIDTTYPSGATTTNEFEFNGSKAATLNINTNSYGNFVGLKTDTADSGKSGLVPAPVKATDTGFFLRSDGSWAEAGAVRSVRGASDEEDAKQTGDVVLSPANVGALALTGGTMAGNIVLSDTATILPQNKDAQNIGSADNSWNTIYAQHLSGTAERVNKRLLFNGDVTSDGIATDLSREDASNTVHVNLKLKDDIGTVYVGETEPTEEHVKLWVKIG